MNKCQAAVLGKAGRQAGRLPGIEEKGKNYMIN